MQHKCSDIRKTYN